MSANLNNPNLVVPSRLKRFFLFRSCGNCICWPWLTNKLFYNLVPRDFSLAWGRGRVGYFKKCRNKPAEKEERIIFVCCYCDGKLLTTCLYYYEMINCVSGAETSKFILIYVRSRYESFLVNWKLTSDCRLNHESYLVKQSLPVTGGWIMLDSCQ